MRRYKSKKILNSAPLILISVMMLLFTQVLTGCKATKPAMKYGVIPTKHITSLAYQETSNIIMPNSSDTLNN